MTFDPFANSGDSLVAPAKQAFAITPHSTDDLPMAAKAFYVGTAGDVVIRAMDSDADVTLVNVAAGSILPIRIRAVRSTSTASNIVGLA